MKKFRSFGYKEEAIQVREISMGMETANWSEGEQNFIKGIIKFAKKFHESIPPKLKKCPFCGQTPTLDLNGDQFIVECDCGCVVGSFDSKWDAVASWNIRVGKRRG